MKKNIIRTVAAAGLMMLALASAQAQQRRTLNVNVPFDFNAGEKTLPAGAYTLTELSSSAYVLRDSEQQPVAVVRADAAVSARDDKARGPRVAFRKYEDRVFLAQVWMTGGAEGQELHRSGAERRLSEELKLSRDSARPEPVTVTAAQSR